MQNQRPEDRPPYVKFSVRAVEDRTKEIEKGMYAFKDVDMAHITVVGQKDTVDREAGEWLADLRKKAADGRVPPEWPGHFQKMYDFWKSGQELPVDGTPIRGWTVLPPSLQESLLLLGILTVEDLANITDEASARIGIGGQSLRTKARAWLAAAEDKGTLANAMAALQQQNEAQAAQIATLMAAVETLKSQLPPEAREKVAAVASAAF